MADGNPLRKETLVRSGTKIFSRITILTLLLLPLTGGAECSRNAVGQAAATTAANTFVTEFVRFVFDQLTNIPT